MLLLIAYPFSSPLADYRGMASRLQITGRGRGMDVVGYAPYTNGRGASFLFKRVLVLFFFYLLI
jgi:hypothetical protein